MNINVVFGILGLSHCVATLSRPSTIVFENNQYKNVVIAIHESVAEDRALITTLKDSMTKASKYLYTATRHRAYLKEVKLLLPSTWSNDASYRVPTKETINLADVIITNTTSRHRRSIPQTRSYEGCGKQGIHVLLTHEFLTLPRVVPYYNDPAKYFIHAFAQFRWGVFQEYAEEGESQFYFSLSTGHPEAIRCTRGLRGLVQKNDATHTICYTDIDKETGVYTPECLWRPYPTRQNVKASMMDFQWIQAIETFCDDDAADAYLRTQHNYEAPSKHNRLCSHRSTWDVISNSDDFKDGINQPVDLLDNQLEPTFTVLRAASTRRKRAVIMVDSSSVKQNDTTNIKKTIDRFRNEMSHQDIETLLLPLDHSTRTTNPAQSAEDILHVAKDVDDLSDNSSEFTEMAVNVIKDLENQSEEHELYAVFLCTSLGENAFKFLKKIKQSTIKTFVILTLDCQNTLMGDSNDDSRYRGLLDRETPEHNVYTEGTTAGHSLLDKLRHVVIGDDSHTKHVVIHREDVVLTNQQEHSYVVDFDDTLKSRTTFMFHYESSRPMVTLVSPSGAIYNKDSRHSVIDEHLQCITFYFETIQTGTWKSIVKLSDDSVQRLSFIVTSKQNVDNEDHILIRTSVKKYVSEFGHLVLHADVTLGSQPVIGLNVTARVETPSGDIEDVLLLDNGAGADIGKEDGVYSRFFTKLQSKGLYHVTFVVNGNGGRIYRKEESFLEPDYDDDSVHLRKMVHKRSLAGSIQRHVPGESIYHDTSMSCNNCVDVMPPSRITDLHVATFLPYRNTLVLKWTAPGDDLDHGTLQTYELLIGENIQDVRQLLSYGSSSIHTRPGLVHMQIHDATVNATETEVMLWKIKSSAGTVAFAVRGVDFAGNKGAISNVATTGIKVRRFA